MIIFNHNSIQLMNLKDNVNLIDLIDLITIAAWTGQLKIERKVLAD